MGIIIYNLFLWIYRLGLRLVSPWNPKARQWLLGRKGIFDKIRASVGSTPAPMIWMHCASLGEFEQGRPVLETVRSHYPGYKIFLTFFSPSGYEVRKDYKGVDFIFYLPIDSTANARKLLKILQPQLVLWVKYEYWNYYLQAIHRQKIPLLLVSGIFREDQPFFKWYGNFHRKMLECFSQFFVQTAQSKKLLGSIGLSNNVIISGDTRFDRVVQIAESFSPIPVIENFCGNSQVIVAGSTWIDDEEEMDHYANTHPDLKFIIAPHEINEEHLGEIEKLFHNTIRFSKFQESLNQQETRDLPTGEAGEKPEIKNVLIIDNIGMLSRLYKYATITYIGGGFGDDGVHNVLEAAVYGKPVVFGPEYEKYIEAIDLVESGAAFPIEHALGLEERFNRLLFNADEYSKACKAAGDYVYGNKGATEKILNYIQANRLLTN